MKLSYVFILIILSSCTRGIDLKNVDYSVLLNDSNSKVWIVEELISNGVDVSGVNTYSKDLIIFHESRDVNIIPMKALGDAAPKRGKYDLNSIKNEITFEMEGGETWKMQFDYVTEDSVLMIPRKKGTSEFSMKIKPFPTL